MENIKFVLEKSARIDKLVDALYAKMPEIESARGKLVTESYKNSEKFLNEVDAACVYVNASTRFTDGFEFGFLLFSGIGIVFVIPSSENIFK